MDGFFQISPKGSNLTNLSQLKPGVTVQGALFPEPVEIIVVVPMGNSIKLIGKGLRTGLTHGPILTLDQVGTLTVSELVAPFDGDANRFRLGIEANRLGLAYEYDPYFTLSIARVDPLPHQLEAVYDYFLKLPRIRFLLADDPGAGKTIMAGLLIKEMKIRGMIKRVLIVTPANLSFQWQREMKDKFRENFEVIRGDILRANYGSNPWQERNQVITSISWISRVDDARESLLRSHWDLIIVDEAHKMSAYSSEKKTLAYQLGEKLSEMTDHYLLMTATPHKGDPQNFSLFLSLLDKDVYGDIKSLEEAMRRNSAPFYLRRVKEAMVTFPDPITGQAKLLFTKRIVHTSDFQIDAEEWDFYDALTRYVEDQSIQAASDSSPRGRALGFTMAMLQRRFASSVYAVRRSLERMRDKREKILKNPEAYQQEQINKRLPEDFDDLTDEEQQQIITELEGIVASVNPADLKAEIAQLNKLIQQACLLEEREVETKLTKLREVLIEQGVFADSKMKLLIFTEHKDTLDYLVGKLRVWGLTVTQIHGGLKIGDRDMAGTRLYAEREFKDTCQVMVATEAAGEGINLQFCWFMINYDIPWNPMRLEQRMGRIHRYGQEKDCLVFNFVSTNTREGRVLSKLFERLTQIERDLDPRQTGKVFNVLGDIFPANQLERMLREMYAHNLTEDVIKSQIVEQVDIERFRKITHSTLEGLAKRTLNLSAIIGKSAEAKERRLVPEVVEDFFTEAAHLVNLYPKEVHKGQTKELAGRGYHPLAYRIGRVPRGLWPIGESLEPRFGKLGHEYPIVVFDRDLLKQDPAYEWITPGHPLFEAVRSTAAEITQSDLKRGAVFYDLNRTQSARLDVFCVAVRDGRGNELHRRLFVVETDQNGQSEIRQPTLFLDLIAAPQGTQVPDGMGLPAQPQIEQVLWEKELQGLLSEVSQERLKEIDVITQHMEISLNAIIDRIQCQFGDLVGQRDSGSLESGLDGRIKMMEDRLDELNSRLERRRNELQQEKNCTISEIRQIGQAWVLPHPERTSPGIAAMVRDDEIEKIAVDKVIEYEEARGWKVQSVEAENRGFDLISRLPHPEDPQTALAVRFIEVKGRAGVGEVALSDNEYKTAGRLKKDYWLYVVYNCASAPTVYPILDPAQLDWKPIVVVEHYHIGSNQIMQSSTTT